MDETTANVVPTVDGSGEPIRFPFDDEFQQGLAALALRDTAFMRRCSHLLYPAHFESVGLAGAVQIALRHFKQYGSAIDRASLKIAVADALNKKVIGEADKPMVIDAVKKAFTDNLPSAAPLEAKLAEFARHQAVTAAILRSAEALNKDEYETIEDAMKKALDVGANEEGDAYDYYEEIENRTNERKDKLAGVTPPRGITTGVLGLDDVLYHRGWGRREMSVLMGAAKAGKCVKRDTLIFTERGLAEIGDFIPSDLGVDEYRAHQMMVLGRNGMELTSHVYNSGLTKTKRIATKCMGLEIEGTHHHPMLVFDERQGLVWKRLEEIKIGDYLAVQRGAGIYGNRTDIGRTSPALPDTMTPDLAEWLGMIVAGGHGGHEAGVITFTQKDPQIMDRFVELTKTLFALEPKVTMSQRENNVAEASFNSRILTAYLVNLGVSFDGSASVEISWAIRQAPRECVLRFVGVVLGLAGCVEKFSYGLMLTSKKIIRQLQMFLLNEGVIANYSVATTGQHDSYRLSIYNANSLIRLCKTFGIYENHKILAGVEGCHVPAIDELKEWVGLNYAFDQVASIEDDEAETVDLTVPGTHSFFANGLISHNTAHIVNFAANASKAGYNVLYATLEVSARIIAERLDACVSDTAVRELEDNIISVNDKIRMRAAKSGRFIIHEFPSGMMTPRMLRKLIEKYRNRGLIFDLVAVDYADIMAPDYRTDNVIENSKEIYLGLRAIAFEFDCALLTATQSNREGVKAVVVKAEHVAEDFNKIRTADLVISINATEEERNNGEERLYFAASRNQESGFTVRVKQDMKKMQAIQSVIGVE